MQVDINNTTIFNQLETFNDETLFGHIKLMDIGLDICNLRLLSKKWHSVITVKFMEEYLIQWFIKHPVYFIENHYKGFLYRKQWELLYKILSQGDFIINDMETDLYGSHEIQEYIPLMEHLLHRKDVRPPSEPILDFIYYIENDNLEAINLYIKYKIVPDYNVRYETILYYALRRGSIPTKIVTSCLNRNNLNITDKLKSLLVTKIPKYGLDIIQIVLTLLNNHWNRKLCILFTESCLIHYNKDVFNYISNYNVTNNDNGQLIPIIQFRDTKSKEHHLIQAIQFLNIEVVDYLLQRINPNKIDYSNHNIDICIISILLMSQRRSKDMTHEQQEQTKLDIITLMVSRGYMINLIDDDTSPHSCAYREGYMKIYQYLLDISPYYKEEDHLIIKKRKL